jgi:CheY-like chemotaxis protein
MGMDRHQAKILVADDSAEDLFFLARAFEKAGLQDFVTSVPDGEQAIQHLERARPDLLLLDLKMPKLTGFDVLKWIQARPELSGLQVVVFSSSDLPEDKKRAKELGAKGYLVKTSDWEKFVAELDTQFLPKA